MLRKTFVTLALPVIFFACGGQTSELRPAAHAEASRATVNSKAGPNGNTTLTVEVEHLAPPDKVAQDASVYVVWARPHVGDQPMQNLGALQVDDDRKGKLETVTPLKSFDVIVTPESSSQVTKPAHDPVLTGKVER
jgi:hypothetical protein